MPRSSLAPNPGLMGIPRAASKDYAKTTPPVMLERPARNGRPPTSSLAEVEMIGSARPETLIEKLSRREELLDSKQVVGLLGVHITTLQLWTRRGDIPFLKVGHSVRFDPAQLAQWLGKRQIGV